MQLNARHNARGILVCHSTYESVCLFWQRLCWGCTWTVTCSQNCTWMEFSSTGMTTHCPLRWGVRVFHRQSIMRCSRRWIEALTPPPPDYCHKQFRVLVADFQMSVGKVAFNEVQLLGQDSGRYRPYGCTWISRFDQQQTSEQIIASHTDVLFQTESIDAGQQLTRRLAGISSEDVLSENCSSTWQPQLFQVHIHVVPHWREWTHTGGQWRERVFAPRTGDFTVLGGQGSDRTQDWLLCGPCHSNSIEELHFWNLHNVQRVRVLQHGQTCHSAW